MPQTDREKKIHALLKGKSNRELNNILDQPHTDPVTKKAIRSIFDSRMEADPEFQKHKEFMKGDTKKGLEVVPVGDSGIVGLLTDKLPEKHGTLNLSNDDQVEDYNRLVRSALRTGSISEQEELREKVFKMSGVDIFKFDIHGSGRRKANAEILEKSLKQPVFYSEHNVIGGDKDELVSDLMSFDSKIKSKLNITSGSQFIGNPDLQEKYKKLLQRGIEPIPTGSGEFKTRVTIDSGILKKIDEKNNGTFAITLDELFDVQYGETRLEDYGSGLK